MEPTSVIDKIVSHKGRSGFLYATLVAIVSLATGISSVWAYYERKVSIINKEHLEDVRKLNSECMADKQVMKDKWDAEKTEMWNRMIAIQKERYEGLGLDEAIAEVEKAKKNQQHINKRLKAIASEIK